MDVEEPLSPSLLEEEEQEEQVVVEESEEEEEETRVTSTPPASPGTRLEEELVPTSPIILSQRRVVRRRRTLGSEAALGGSQSQQMEAAQGEEDVQNQDHQAVEEVGLEPVAPLGPEEVPDVGGPAAGAGMAQEVSEAQEVSSNGPAEQPSHTTVGGDQGEISGKDSNEVDSRPKKKKRKRESEDEVFFETLTFFFVFTYVETNKIFLYSRSINVIALRDAPLSKKCSFFEHCSNGGRGGSTHVQKLCRKLSCVLEVI